MQSFDGKQIVAIPLSYDVNDMPSMKYGNSPASMLEVFKEVVEIARTGNDELRIIDVTGHAHICGHPRGAHYYEKIIEQAVSASDLWVGTRAQIADHVLARLDVTRQSDRHGAGRPQHSPHRSAPQGDGGCGVPYQHLRLPGMLHGKFFAAPLPTAGSGTLTCVPHGE